MELVDVRENEYLGEYVLWNRPLTELRGKFLPEGKYLVEKSTFFVANESGGNYYPSNKHSYRNVVRNPEDKEA